MHASSAIFPENFPLPTTHHSLRAVPSDTGTHYSAGISEANADEVSCTRTQNINTARVAHS